MPIYTYRCEQGHEWDEVRNIERSETSEGPCPTCMDNADRQGVELFPEEVRACAGRKVPSSGVNVIFKGSGFTPKFYPNRGK